jgi:regulator of protease activity HflC (stomatin/prohibitin superfamily)
MDFPLIVPILVIILLLIFSSIKILREYERAVIFRLGRLIGCKGPGMILLIPFVDKMVKVSLRTLAIDVQRQDIITKDNISVKIDAVLFFKVKDPIKAILEVENYMYATNQIAQTTFRSIIGQSDLDQLLSEQEQINERLRIVIDKHTEPWGIEVSSVEVKQIDLPIEMQRAMAKQAEAERERRAKVINAEGELQASYKLTEAASKMETSPVSIQLRFLQTLTDIASEKNSTILFPIPIDLLTPFLKKD